LSKVLWFSDAGCTTGFSRVTHAIGERLAEDFGHEMHIMAVNYRGDAWGCERPGHDHVTPMRLYRPSSLRADDIYGKTRIVEMLGKVEPDVVVTLNDPQVLIGMLIDNQFDEQKILLKYKPILSYIPDDGENLPPPWTTLLPKMTNVIAMSKHGQSHYKPSKLVYHGVDRESFWPIEEAPKVCSNGRIVRTKGDCKEAFGIPRDTFLVGRVDTNSGRKDYAALVKALWPVMERHSNVSAWFHCADKAPGVGLRFQSMLLRNPKVLPDRFYFPDTHDTFEGWPIEDMNVLLSAFDVFVSPSRGEGFGLGLAEAAACGIPIIAQNVSAIPEVVGPGGLLLEPDRLFTVPSGEDNWLPDIEAFTDAIEKMYNSSGLRRDLGAAGTDHVRKSFSWDVAASKFDEYITSLSAYVPPEAAWDGSLTEKNVTSTEASEGEAALATPVAMEG
jgi:glycosyltransferase involved in cell wall biosynthesis